MVSLYFEKRDDDCIGYNCDDSSTWAWARWILFVLFFLGLIMILFGAFRVNKRRAAEGLTPIRGTAWMTPPSYIQSQHNTQNPPYVPQYTANANDNDMGYYDANGQFIPNPKAREAFPMGPVIPDQTGSTQRHGSSNGQGFQPPPGPPPAVIHTTGQNEDADFDRDFSRYYGNSAAPNANIHSNPASSPPPPVDGVNYQRPDVPPPSHVKTM